MLFRPCGAIVHDNECREPVINFGEDTRCVYHTMMPPLVISEQVSKDFGPFRILCNSFYQYFLASSHAQCVSAYNCRR